MSYKLIGEEGDQNFSHAVRHLVGLTVLEMHLTVYLCPMTLLPVVAEESDCSGCIPGPIT